MQGENGGCGKLKAPTRWMGGAVEKGGYPERLQVIRSTTDCPSPCTPRGRATVHHFPHRPGGVAGSRHRSNFSFHRAMTTSICWFSRSFSGAVALAQSFCLS